MARHLRSEWCAQDSCSPSRCSKNEIIAVREIRRRGRLVMFRESVARRSADAAAENPGARLSCEKWHYLSQRWQFLV